VRHGAQTLAIQNAWAVAPSPLLKEGCCASKLVDGVPVPDAVLYVCSNGVFSATCHMMASMTPSKIDDAPGKLTKFSSATEDVKSANEFRAMFPDLQKSWGLVMPLR
jgi:hypothetical protein